MAVEIYMPKMSEDMETGKVVRWLAKEGEAVERGQVILELETDKVTAEVEAPEAGILKGVRAPEGLDVPVGETIAFIVRSEDEQLPSLPPLGDTSGDRTPDAAA